MGPMSGGGDENTGRATTGVYAEKFRLMLDLIPYPDGGRWTGARMERATGGVIAASYFSTLKDGRIEVPKADKLEAIAEAMGFAPGLWFEELAWWRGLREKAEVGADPVTELETRGGNRGTGRMSGLLDRLFEARLNAETGEPFTEAEVACRSGGALSEQDVGDLRRGSLAEPTWAQVLALSDVFGVDLSYWSDSGGDWGLSPALLRATRDPNAYVIFQNSLKLSEEGKGMLRALSEHLRREGERG